VLSPLLLTACNPGPMTGAGNNTYLLAADGGSAALVDAGIGDPRHLAALAEALGDRQARLETVLVTHGHRDHAAGAPALAAAHVGAVFAKRPWPEEDARYGVAWRSIDEGDVVWGAGEPLRVLHTPGHSPDHLAFWHEPTRSVFTGDLVVAGSSVMIDSTGGGDLAQYLASLERIRALEPRLLLPAHGPRIEEPRRLLDGYLAHRRSRERQVIEALASGRSTVQAIAEFIYHGLDPALMPAAQENVRAHLEKLRAEGRAFRDHDLWRL
jgi:glyoxylase-like metal-dependent hydrolase (beta-lactamase superfamily II)